MQITLVAIVISIETLDKRKEKKVHLKNNSILPRLITIQNTYIKTNNNE